jgi:hypothetical protein
MKVQTVLKRAREAMREMLQGSPLGAELPGVQVKSLSK